MPTFDFTCLHCGGKMEVSRRYGKIQCTECQRFMDGTRPTQENTRNGMDAASADQPLQTWNLGNLLYKEEMTIWLKTLVSTLRTDLAMGERDKAIRTCERLLDMEAEFLDAYLWLAKLNDDPVIKRENLEKLLALTPNNIEATRMMMILNGELTEEEAARSEDVYFDNRQITDDPIASQTEALLCPICRGTLTVNETNQHVTCDFCGFSDTSLEHAVKPNRNTSVTVALIKQRGKAVRWEVGKRLVHCHECGAERVLPAGKMSSRCPFCNSTHVVMQDALGAFRQPDGLVKFRVSRRNVEQLLDEHLAGFMEKLKGVFIRNKVVRTQLQGVFLPFWIFDVFGTVILRDEYRDNDSYGLPLVERTEHPAAMRNARVSAVHSPAKALTDRLGKYELDDYVPYTPKLLSKFAAELYTIDFDQASLDVRSVFRREMLSRYSVPNPNLKRDVTSSVDQMDMRLILLPVWVATLTEEDDDIRIALINGQTGQIAMGRANKST